MTQAKNSLFLFILLGAFSPLWSLEQVSAPTLDAGTLFVPQSVTENESFKLQIFSQHFDCNTNYSDIKVIVKDRSIVLTYHPYQSTKRLCEEGGDYGPIFKIPGLGHGDYGLIAREIPECMKKGSCEVLWSDEPFGYLTVTPRLDFQPKSAEAGSIFRLQVTGSQYTCATSFSHQSVNISDGKLHLRYVAETAHNVFCAMPVAPIGPWFEVPALKVGDYEVLVSELPACAVCSPYSDTSWVTDSDGRRKAVLSDCAICDIAILPVSVGKLNVFPAKHPEPKYTLTPTTIKANTSSPIQLLSYDFNCAHSYSHKEIAVSGNNLYLTFHAKADPRAFCPEIYRPYGPRFQLPPLEKGSYKVYASRLADCMIVQPTCKMAVVPELVSTIQVVAEANEPDWTMTPQRSSAHQSFTLKLRSQRYGSCQTEFRYPSVQIGNGQIDLSAVAVHHPERVCIWDQRPFGPDFEISPLKPGTYKVSFGVLPDCNGPGPCVMGWPVYQVGELSISGTTSLDERKSAVQYSKDGIRLSLSGFSPGTVRLELRDLEGKLLRTLDRQLGEDRVLILESDALRSQTSGLVVLHALSRDGKRSQALVRTQ